MKKVVFTGGGSAGHVTPNIALFGRLQAEGVKIEYIGSEQGIERQMIEGLGDVPYHPIATGKLRRYFDLKNLKDPFRVIKGALQSYRLLRRIRPDVVFSKGGFVSVPVMIGSKLNGIPAVIHESDMTPGLANKLSIPLATKVCVTFPETLSYLPKGKAVYTGPPIREELLIGNAEAGRKRCGFHSAKPIVLVMGGSLGSQAINKALRESLDDLLRTFQIAHLCGKGNIDRDCAGKAGYCQFEYIGAELPDMLAMADIAVSRAGSNAIFELLAVRKPMLLIPLSKQASRGDQILNAQSFERAGYCRILYEERLEKRTLQDEIHALWSSAEEIAERMAKRETGNSISQIVEIIRSAASK